MSALHSSGLVVSLSSRRKQFWDRVACYSAVASIGAGVGLVAFYLGSPPFAVGLPAAVVAILSCGTWFASLAMRERMRRQGHA